MHCELSWTSHACSNTWLFRISRLCSFNLLPWTEWNPCGVALWIWRTSPMSPSVGCSTASHPSFWMARCLFFSSFPLVWHWLHGHLKGSQTTLRVPLHFHSNYAYYLEEFFFLQSTPLGFWAAWTSSGPPEDGHIGELWEIKPHFFSRCWISGCSLSSQHSPSPFLGQR